MSNMDIYKKTLTFSIRKLLVDFLTLLLVVGLCVAGFILMDKATGNGLAGMAIGLIIGFFVAAFISRFVSYALKAGQIAMMTKGVAEDALPDNVYAEGKAIVKRRFATVAAYFAVTKIIRGIFNQLGRAITSLGNAVGGDTGKNIGSTISSVIQVVVSYLCDCCLGWVFYREDQSSAKATCEGAVLFFKHGKTFIKNMGRVFGIGLLSLLVIGGVFFGIFYGIALLVPDAITALANRFAETSQKSNPLYETLTNPTTLTVFIAAVAGFVVWNIIHSAFIRPFILTGVLRNYINSGKNDIPTEDAFRELDSKSPKFAELHKEIG